MMNDNFILKEQIVQYKLIKAYCPHCGREELTINTDEMLLSKPPQYKYFCNNCGAEYYSANTYPMLILNDDDNENSDDIDIVSYGDVDE